MNAVVVEGACKSYGKGVGKSVILDNLSMNIRSGSIYALIGASGCGKTTLLSCMLGMIPLDSGKMTIFGQEIKTNEIYKVGRRVGYMPQETALVGELTVKETLFFFGNIYQVELKTLSQRFEMIRTLLELPSDETLVQKCSSGEQRRISFAAAIIHKPDLLILDEPTVGLDPVLREKIWGFLISAKQTSGLTVIITTHYIAEAEKADRVGLIRNGALLGEDSPLKIMSNFNVTSLEEAFLIMCVDDSDRQTVQTTLEIKQVTSEKQLAVENKANVENMLRKQIVKELMTKNYLKLKRQPSLFFFTMILTVFQLVLFYYTMGRPSNLKLAIFNEEFQNHSEYSIPIETMITSRDGKCIVKKASYKFINAIDDKIVVKSFFNTFDEAYEELKHGRAIALLRIRKNFSQLTTDFLESEEQNPMIITKDTVEIFRDRTVISASMEMESQISKAFSSFLKELFTNCKQSSKFLQSPLLFDKPLYGSYVYEFKDCIAHVLITVWCFFISSTLTVTAFITDRREGFWNRTLLAGVHFREMLLAQSLVYSLVIVILSLEGVVYVGIIYKSTNFLSFITVFALLVITGLSGMFFGICLSTICPNTMTVTMLTIALTIAITSIVGVFHPVEMMVWWIQYLSNSLPFVHVSKAIKFVMVKEFTILNPTVAAGFFIAFLWMILSIALGLWALKIRKYTRNT